MPSPFEQTTNFQIKDFTSALSGPYIAVIQPFLSSLSLRRVAAVPHNNNYYHLRLNRPSSLLHSSPAKW